MPATLKSRIPQIASSLQPRAEGATKVASEAIAQRYRDRAPVRSGGLRDSIEVRDADDGHGVYAAWYYRYPEFGTNRSAAHPALIPAAEAVKASIDDIVRASLQGL